ncbi:MAG: peptidoglycan DD-metalloendopeptidase family protein [Pseudomonadota bacterium]|nr:peptidoglycan DD-metalloendopeptidase family protein [Pseudomonadota bacterium]
MALCALLVTAAASGAPARPTERSKQKAAAEVQRAGIQQKLSALKRDISKTESAKEDAADTLAASEEAISDANRALRDLGQEQGETNTKLANLNANQHNLNRTIDTQKQQLAKLLRQHYVGGNEDRIKLLLSGDNPNRINRDMQMLSYVSQAQARLLSALRTNLVAVEANKEEAQNAKDELEEIAQEQRDQKVQLEKEKAKRAALLGTLSTKLVAQRKEAGNLARDEQRMTGLVDQLSKLIREQAIAAAAERKRLAAVAEARAKAAAEAKLLAETRARAQRAERERERLAQQHRAPNKSGKPEPVEPRIVEQAPVVERPVKVEKPDPAAARAADIALAPAAPDGAFAGLRGRMSAPIAGRIAARFGAKRGDGPTWKGMFIKAGEGSEVRAVAGGRVVFANWMRGFGNLIIIDHGSEYLSIYGNNQTLLKSAGDTVKAGDQIASAGNTGGNEESGLYFELRHLGKAFDPAGWIKF